MIPNFWIAEFFVNLKPACDEIAVEPLTVKDSFVELPTTPGHGIDIDVTRLQGAAVPRHGAPAKGCGSTGRSFRARTTSPARSTPGIDADGAAVNPRACRPDRPPRLRPSSSRSRCNAATDFLHARDICLVRSDNAPCSDARGSSDCLRSARVAAKARYVPSRSASSPSGSGALYRFHPVNVPRGTAMSGRRMPAISLPSASTCGTSALPACVRRLRIGPVAERHDIVWRVRRHQRRQASARPPPPPAPACRQRCAAAGMAAARDRSPPIRPAPPAARGWPASDRASCADWCMARRRAACPPCRHAACRAGNSRAHSPAAQRRARRTGSVCSSDAPFCQYSVEVLVSISFGSLSSPRSRAPGRRQSVVEHRGGERELHLREVVVLMPGAGARRLAELGVEEYPADAGDMGEHAVEHARPSSSRLKPCAM